MTAVLALIQRSYNVRARTMDDKLIYIINDDQLISVDYHYLLKIGICILSNLKLVTNQNLIKVPTVLEPTTMLINFEYQSHLQFHCPLPFCFNLKAAFAIKY